MAGRAVPGWPKRFCYKKHNGRSPAIFLISFPTAMTCPFKKFCDGLRPFPEPNSYIVFSIDPVATVESLNDRDLIFGCQLIENKKYVALVTDVSHCFELYWSIYLHHLSF